MLLRGRLVSTDPPFLQNEDGVIPFELRGGDAGTVGDLVLIEDGVLRVLVRSRRSATTIRRVLDPRRRRVLDVRARVEAEIRHFFVARGFREVRTPLIVPCPGMEPHIRPFALTSGTYLPTSPEFAMKRLLVGGLEKIFQITPAFRDEPSSVTHRPEFTLLEWYRAYATYEDIQRDTEELVCHLAIQIHGTPELSYQGKTFSVSTPWPRLRARDLFLQHASVDLTHDDLGEACHRLGIATSAGDTWDDLYFRIWLGAVEPRLPCPVLVTRYPASQAALSVIDADPDGSRWARRFEAYAGGLELANAFEELTDPTEQRRRFEADMELRARTYGPSFPKSPLPEEVLAALEEGMPPSGGIALGVDRLVMLLCDEPDIDYTFFL
jgi:lysyl-tRNA synthetase class 2